MLLPEEGEGRAYKEMVRQGGKPHLLSQSYEASYKSEASCEGFRNSRLQKTKGPGCMFSVRRVLRDYWFQERAQSTEDQAGVLVIWDYTWLTQGWSVFTCRSANTARL